MNIIPIDPLILAAFIGVFMCAAVDISLHGQLTWRTAVWAGLFLGGFYVNYYQQGGKR